MIMEKQLIISLGREFGSAGHEIAQMLATHYGLPLYDHNLLRKIAEERAVAENGNTTEDELFPRKVKYVSSSPQDAVVKMQFDYLKRKAESGESFVVVGRCSEHVLKAYPGLITIFILGDMDCKVERIKRIYELDEDEAIELIRLKDRKRKAYHNSYCEGKWGDSRNYELSINSSKLGLEGTFKILCDYIDSRVAPDTEG